MSELNEKAAMVAMAKAIDDEITALEAQKKELEEKLKTLNENRAQVYLDLLNEVKSRGIKEEKVNDLFVNYFSKEDVTWLDDAALLKKLQENNATEFIKTITKTTVSIDKNALKKAFKADEALKEEYKEQGYSSCFFTIEALAARICRAYNSFNREVELGFRLLQEKNFSTRYSFQDDYYKGIDLGIMYNNQFLGVACYQNNKRANDYKVLKETTRRSNYDKENIISMAIDRNNHDTYGEFWAYSENEFQRLKAKIREKGGISNEY